MFLSFQLHGIEYIFLWIRVFVTNSEKQSSGFLVGNLHKNVIVKWVYNISWLEREWRGTQDFELDSLQQRLSTTKAANDPCFVFYEVPAPHVRPKNVYIYLLRNVYIDLPKKNIIC